MITNIDIDKANILNKYFATFGKKLATSHPEHDMYTDHSLIYRVTPTCSNINIDNVILRNQFIKLTKPGKALGLDKIIAKDLHMIGDPALERLKCVFKKSLETLKIPELWKKNHVSSKRNQKMNAKTIVQSLCCVFRAKSWRALYAIP